MANSARLNARELMTVQEVAELCRTAPGTVLYWRHVGKGPKGFRLGKRVVFRRSDVEAWVSELAKAEGVA